MRILLAVLVTSGFVIHLLAQENSDQVLRVKKTEDFEIVADKINERWETAEWILLTKRKGGLDYPTKVKILYSAQGIYTLFSCDDNVITATLQNDFAELWKEDVIEMFLWPDERTPLYFEYELSPLNYELPILVPNFNNQFLGWRPWQYEGERKTRHAIHMIRDQKNKLTGWMAEFFIPYKLLAPLQNVPPAKGSQWRINLYRNDYDQATPTSWVWKPVATNFHEYKSFGRIVFD